MEIYPFNLDLIAVLNCTHTYTPVNPHYLSDGYKCTDCKKWTWKV